MRRLRPWLAPTDSGGRGSPSGPTTGLCRLTAGRGQVEGWRKPAGSAALVAASLARKHGPSNRKAAVARRKALRAWLPPSHGGGEARVRYPTRLSARCLPSCWRGDISHTSDSAEPRERERLFEAVDREWPCAGGDRAAPMRRCSRHARASTLSATTAGARRV